MKGRTSPAVWPTVLVSMPFMDVDRPSIQIGLLKAIGEAHGFPVRTLHANLDFASRIGVDVYRPLSEHRGRLIGDWLFSVAAFGDAAPDPEGRLLDDFAADLSHFGRSAARVRERLLEMRQRDVPAYLDDLVATGGWADVRVAGFSSTFQQNTASFALARRLKERHPRIVTVFGGANFDGEMGLELTRAVDCVDLAVIGEGDVAFPRLLTALAEGADPADVPGVVRRAADGTVAAPVPGPPPVLDDLPPPDYTEFFERAEELEVLPRLGHRAVWLPFESSRGCWWGAKHHCTFCGLNATSMAFRGKSPGRVAGELAGQARRYRSFQFEAVDNIIDMRYLTTLLPAITGSGADYEIFYEVKANLGRAQLREMARAGVTRIQPGLESLSTPVLELMRKGVRAAQNVNLLRWARYYGIDVAWNILWGFPGETRAEYDRQAEVVPDLWHLQPPSSVIRIWMERFSPLYTEPDTFRIRRREPEPSYRYVYPAGVALDRMAYFFEYELADPLPPEAYAGLTRAASAWATAWAADRRPALTYWSAPGFVQIRDDRTETGQGTYTFADTLADIYLACSDRPTTAAAVRGRLGLDLPVEEITAIFAEFEKRGLMFRDGNLAVSLALPAVVR